MANLSAAYARAFVQHCDNAAERQALGTFLKQIAAFWVQKSALRAYATRNPQWFQDIVQDLPHQALLYRCSGVLSKAKHWHCLPEISRRFEALSRKIDGTESLVFETAQPLCFAEQKSIKESVETQLKRSFDWQWVDTKSHIAGCIIKQGDRVYNGSLQDRLSTLKQYLLTGEI